MALRGFLISAFAVLAGATDAVFIQSGGSTSAIEAAP